MKAVITEAAVAKTNKDQGKSLKIQIRWMIRRDMPLVFEIDEKSSPHPWSEEDFSRQLRRRNCIGMVAEHNNQIVGFMIYELHKASLHVLNFAVHPAVRHRRVGQQMIAKLVDKLSQQRRERIDLLVRESNLSSQFFLKAMGFRAVKVLRGYWDDSGEDAYQMRYSLSEEKSPLQFTNRISKYFGDAPQVS